MSIARLVLPSLQWAELWEVLSFMTLQEVYNLGCTCRSAFVTFLREKELRKGVYRTVKLSSRFLGKFSGHEKVLLVSYPRSGNSYVRKLLEASTGIVTGSDSRPNRVLSASLLRFGYLGEGITDQSVWVVKSHFPERMGFIRFPVSRVVLLVRNPFDAIESYFHMAMTNTHDKTLSTESFERLQSIWPEFIANEALVWSKFHHYWLAIASSVPVLFVRYEDLLNDEQRWLERIMDFLGSGNSPTAYRWKAQWLRRRAMMQDETLNGPGYTPKQRVVGKSLNAALSVSEANTIMERTRPLLELFGYELTSLPSKPGESTLGTPRASTYYSMKLRGFSPEQASPLLEGSTTSSSTLVINDLVNIRDEHDKFGRRITDLRRTYTANDTIPFSTK